MTFNLVEMRGLAAGGQQTIQMTLLEVGHAERSAKCGIQGRESKKK
jgi:hypothetical protein